MFLDYLFKSLHDICRLDRVRARSHSQIYVGSRQVKVPKKYLRHVLIVMLSGMNDHRRESVGMFQKLKVEGRDLHEIGSGSSHQQYLLHSTNLLLFFLAYSRPGCEMSNPDALDIFAAAFSIEEGRCNLKINPRDNFMRLKGVEPCFL
jgi:hypothetical protein